MTDPSDTARPDDAGASGKQIAAVVVAAVALAGVLGWTARDPASGGETEPPPVAALRGEVDAMVASGVPEDHPKVEMLNEEADALAERWGEEGAPEPGVDLEAEAARGALASSPDEAERQSAEVGTDLPARTATVDCEPIPHLLTPEEVAGARCMTVPQPDGSSLFVAVAPTGDVRTVGFRPGGEVARMADTRLPFGAEPATAELAPGLDAGSVEVHRQGVTLGTMTIADGA